MNFENAEAVGVAILRLMDLHCQRCDLAESARLALDRSLVQLPQSAHYSLLTVGKYAVGVQVYY